MDNANNTLPSFSVRPGVTFPNWSVVESTVARDALLAIFDVFNIERCWTGYSDIEDTVRTAILVHFGRYGRPPTVAELSLACGMDQKQVLASLHSLKARDFVVFDDKQSQITGAYPFTERETGHRVKLGDIAVNAMCAVDALGAGAMYGSATTTVSSCRSCGATVEIATRDNGHSIHTVSPAETVVWTGIQYEGQAATSLCTVIAFFCGDAHLQEWRSANREERGFRMSLDEALETGRAIFMPFLEGVDPRPRTANLAAQSETVAI